MRHSKDDRFGDNRAGRAEWEEELERSRDALLEAIDEAVEENQIIEELVPTLLVEIAATLRSTVYAASAARPSASGLKLDLDRFQREFGDMVRGIKKNADEFIRHAKQVMDAETEDEEPEDEE